MTPARRATRSRRGFTLVEVLVAGVLVAFVLGSISMTLSHLSRAKATSKERLDAYLRADAALTSMRKDIASVVRSDDLFYCRFLLYDSDVNSPLGDLARDELVVFNTHMRAIRDIDFNGEGSEYETQFRVEDDENGTMLYRRRDPFPDDYPLAGGMVVPMIENIVSLNIEAYDGTTWLDGWDSDVEGLPRAVRVTVVASGARPGQDVYDAFTTTLRTVVAIDRVIQPKDNFKLTEDELAELDERVLIDTSDTEDSEEAGEADSGEADRAGDQRGGSGGDTRGGDTRGGGGGRGGTDTGGGGRGNTGSVNDGRGGGGTGNPPT